MAHTKAATGGYNVLVADESVQGGLITVNIPDELFESFNKTFGEKPPSKDSYDEWAKQNQAKSKTPSEGYKIKPELKKEIYDYLNKRPMVETNALINSFMFEVKDADPFYTAEGIKALTEYLQTVCPRSEAKPLIEKLANGGLEKYELKPKTQADAQ